MNKALTLIAAKLLVLAIIIMVIALWTYYPTTRNLFVWDSNGYLFIYEFWISKLSPYHIVWMFTSFEFMNWHPLTWVSWAIDYQIYNGLNPWGYHLSNNILHALNSTLVFVLALVVFGLNHSKQKKGFPFRTDHRALVAGFLTALLFAVHPQHVEPVAWVAQRKDLLVQLFLLLSLLSYVKYVNCSEKVKKRWFGWTLFLFVLALLSKPMAVTFPVVLLLIDVYPLRRTKFVPSKSEFIKQQTLISLTREKIPFFLLTVISVLITLYAQQGALSQVSLDLRILNAANSVILYLTKFWIPLGFVPLYPYSVNAGEALVLRDFVPLLGVAAITLATLFAWKKGHHGWLIAWLFFLVTLSPVIGLIQVGLQGAADRYAYFPTLPFYFLTGLGILVVLDRVTSVKRHLVWLAVLPLVFILAGKTREQIAVWETNETLWSYVIERFPTNAFAHKNLGGYYFSSQDFEGAYFHFKESERLNPNDPKAVAWHGLSALHLGRYEEALTTHIKLASSLELNPHVEGNEDCIQYNIAWIFAKINLFSESSELFNRVGPGSELSQHAIAWLNWLRTTEATAKDATPPQELPGFCSKLLPSM